MHSRLSLLIIQVVMMAMDKVINSHFSFFSAPKVYFFS